jgi:hypothetical protein
MRSREMPAGKGQEQDTEPRSSVARKQPIIDADHEPLAIVVVTYLSSKGKEHNG